MQDASIVRTGKLYEEDAYRTEFDAKLLAAESYTRESDGACCADLILDRTCFFPEEGGQCPDRGILMGLPVFDVKIRDGEIHHHVEWRGGAEESALCPGSTVYGCIDWPFRFSNMQQHSGEHLFSGIVHTRYGFENVGFHLSAHEVTLDFDGVIPEAELPELEREVNDAIFRNIASEVRVTTREEREGLVYRSKLELPGEVRIVTFPGIDSCACCAPHIRRTGEIGLLKVVSMIRWKGGVRVSIACGGRALALFQRDHAIVRDTAAYLSTSAEQIFPQVGRLREENRALAAGLKQAAARELVRMAEALSPEEENPLLFVEGADNSACREAVNAMTERCGGFCGVFSGHADGGYSFVIGSRTRDCREAAAALREQLGARGGGKQDMVQGSVQAGEGEIRRVLAGR